MLASNKNFRLPSLCELDPFPNILHSLRVQRFSLLIRLIRVTDLSGSLFSSLSSSFKPYIVQNGVTLPVIGFSQNCYIFFKTQRQQHATSLFLYIYLGIVSRKHLTYTGLYSYRPLVFVPSLNTSVSKL